jgi:hypothetical protein
MEPNYDLSLVLVIDNVELFEIKNGGMTLMDRGQLQVYEIPAINIYMIRLNEFKYSLSKELPIMTGPPQFNQG